MSAKESGESNELLDTLVLFTKLYHKPFSADALTAGLPVKHDQTYPELFSTKGAKGLFSRAAKRAGLSSKLVKRDLDEISPLVLPAILVLKAGKACILEKIDETNRKAKIITSELGEAENWVDIDELKKEYTGYVFYIKKEYEFEGRSKQLVDHGKGHWFWDTIKMSSKIYRDVIISSMIINLFIVVTPLFTKNVYDRVVPNGAISTLWVLVTGISVVYILDTIIKMTRAYFLETAAKKSDIIMSSIIFEHVMDMKLSARPKSVGSFANNLRDFDSIRSFLTSASMIAVVDLPFLVIFLVVIYIIAGAMVLIPIFFMLCVIVYLLVIKKPLQESTNATHEAASHKNSVLIESLINLETIKTMNAQGHAQWKWEEATGHIASKGLKAKILSASIPTVTSFFTQLNNIAVIVAGVYLIDAKEMTMGALIAVSMLSSRAIAPIGQIVNLAANFENTKVAYEGINNIMASPVERPAGKQFVHRDNFEGEFVFDNVTFTYPGEDKPALKNVSFKINPKEKVAFIGKIGSGKTTIEKLMLGLYEVDEGAIYLDGIDIKQIDPGDLRRNISYVEQDITLFQGTVKDNIIFKSPSVSDAKIIQASKISGVEDFVNRHPKGFDMSVGERGVGLSGGQRQSISIARALIVDAPIMLLDEPTNMMDSTTEQKVIKNIKNYVMDKTLIVVTHKSSLLALVDRVVVMDQGQIILDGDKQTVLNKLYKKA